MEQQIVLDLDIHDVNTLVIEPALDYENVFQRSTGLYKIVVGKTKWRMTHLSTPSNMLQPKTSCNDWNPNINFRLRPSEIGTVEWEVNGEQCPDEFDEACLRNLKPEADIVTKPHGPTISAMEMAMATQIRRGLGNDFYEVSWFGNLNFGADVQAGEYDLSMLHPTERKNLTRMLEHHNGWWSEAIARTTESGEAGRVRLVDTNDGTAGGNAMNPANIADFLRQMILSSGLILQSWIYKNEGAPPMFLLQSGLYDALIEYYRSIGDEQQRALIMNGEPVPGTTTFDGYVVKRMTDWDLFDHKTGNIDPATGRSKIQRAMFTARENLCLLAHASSATEKYPESGLIIQESPIIKDKGLKFVYATWGFGCGIAQPQLLTIGINSSQNFV